MPKPAALAFIFVDSLRGAQTNMFITALELVVLGAELYKSFICVTSKYLRALPWFAWTAFGGSLVRCCDGISVGDEFEITVPKDEKLLWSNGSAWRACCESDAFIQRGISRSCGGERVLD